MYRSSRAHYTRPPCPSFKRAFSAPVCSAGGVRNSEDRTTTAPGTRLFILLHYTPISFFARVLLARAQHAARALTRASLKFGLRVSPNFVVACCPCSVRLCLSVAVRSALGSHEARARSTPRATSGRLATWRSRGELESGLPLPEAECRSTPRRSNNTMAFCRFARIIYIKPRRSCATVVISFSWAPRFFLAYTARTPDSGGAQTGGDWGGRT